MSIPLESVELHSQCLTLSYQDKRYPIELYENAVDVNRVVARFENGLLEIGYHFLSGVLIESLTVHLIDTSHPDPFPDHLYTSCKCQDLVVQRDQNNNIIYTGFIHHPQTKVQIAIELCWNPTLITRGNTTLSVEGNQAHLFGEIGTQTYWQIERITADHPRVNTLVFDHVTANTNDEIVQHIGRFIRRSGFHTSVPENGVAQGGAIALLIAGTERRVDDGGSVTVSNWYADNARDGSAKILWNNLHQYRIAYFRDMLGTVIGEQCYYFIVNLGESNEYHRLTRRELDSYHIA